MATFIRAARVSLATLALGVCLSASAGAPAIGDIPPDELGIGLDGQPVRVSDFRGRVLITTFWASWCGPCVRELDLLERLQRTAGRDRVVVVAVNWNDSAAKYRLIRQRVHDLSLTLARDDSGGVGERYAVRSIPRMFIIDQDSRLAFSHTGYDPERSVDKILEEVNWLLQHPPAALQPGS